MTADEAVEFFENLPRIRRKVETLCQVGLGYVKLGQSSTTLSGGEAQRVKLATELSRAFPPAIRSISLTSQPPACIWRMSTGWWKCSRRWWMQGNTVCGH